MNSLRRTYLSESVVQLECSIVCQDGDDIVTVIHLVLLGHYTSVYAIFATLRQCLNCRIQLLDDWLVIGQIADDEL